MKKCLTIAGSDCSGGAGIQADLKAFSAMGTFGMSVITSVVAENTSRVISIQDIDCDIISDQIDAVFEDIEVDGVKVGMLSNADIMRTPNLAEAEVLSGMKISSLADMKKAAVKIHDLGAKNVLVKGGHLTGEATDILYDGDDFNSFSQERIYSKKTHGTGCTLSSAITAELAKGSDIVLAVNDAKIYLTEAIRNSFYVGKGNGPVNHFYEYYNMKGF